MWLPDINSTLYSFYPRPFYKDRFYETAYKSFPAMYRKAGEDE